MNKRWFVTGTNTGVGKTVVSLALVHACQERELRVAAIKPLETGYHLDTSDARALAQACGNPGLADALGLYRVPVPLAPYAATLSGHAEPPSLASLATRVVELSADANITIIEGAGGLLVPITQRETMADLARELRAQLIIVSNNQLGTLSQTLSTIESARARQLPLAALVLNEAETRDLTSPTNRLVLQDYLPNLPIVEFPRCTLDAASLLAAATKSQLLTTLLRD